MLQPVTAAAQRQGTHRLATGVDLDDQPRLVGECQQVTGAAVVLETGRSRTNRRRSRFGRSITLDGHRRPWRARKALNFVDAQRVTLPGNKQAPAVRVVGQPLETLVAVAADAERELFAVGRIEALRIFEMRTLKRRCWRSSLMT